MREINRRTAIKDIGLLVGGLTLTALGADECSSYEQGGAVTLPVGENDCAEIFWGNQIGNPTTEAHEKKHCKQIKRLGSKRFTQEYLKNPCKFEVEAGAHPNIHPACKNR